MTDEIKNVFISHIHEDDAGLNKLKDLLGSNGMKVRDYSITADNPNHAHSEDYIKSEILAPRIQQSSTLVVYISPATKDSEYVDWEIKYAAKQNKRIVGVWEQGHKECEVPDALTKLADAVVGWTGNSIVDAINGAISNWQHPDGTSIPPKDIVRYGCHQ